MVLSAPHIRFEKGERNIRPRYFIEGSPSWQWTKLNDVEIYRKVNDFSIELLNIHRVSITFQGSVIVFVFSFDQGSSKSVLFCTLEIKVNINDVQCAMGDTVSYKQYQWKIQRTPSNIVLTDRHLCNSHDRHLCNSHVYCKIETSLSIRCRWLRK